MSLTTDVMDLLDGLGDTDLKVAAKLTEKGIKGVPREECACPIFNYLAAEGLPVANVDQDAVFFSWPGGDELVDLPGAVADFIAGFDHGDFPDLVSAPAVAS